MKHARVVSLIAGVLLVTAGYAQTLEEACQRHMKDRLTEHSVRRFSRGVDLGDVGIYQQALKSVKIVVNPSLEPLARYDPNTETIEVRVDPRTLTTPAERRSFSDTIWHETTHRIEHQNGDFEKSTGRAYDERNVEYMTHVHDVVLRRLEMLEDKAKSGAKPEELKQLWESFQKALEDAKKVPGVPVDPRELRRFFGFNIDLIELEKIYLAPETHPAIREAIGGIAAKPVIPKTGSWVLTQVQLRPSGGMSEADFATMSRGYADSEAQVRGCVLVGSSLFTFKVGDRNYALGAEWSRPPSTMKPGETLILTAKASDKGCQNTPDGDGTFSSFDVALWGNNGGPSWSGYAINLGAIYGAPKKDVSKAYRITFPTSKVKQLHLVVAAGSIHWAREVAYVYEWRDR